MLAVSASGDKGPVFLLLGTACLRPDPEPRLSLRLGVPLHCQEHHHPMREPFRS